MRSDAARAAKFRVRARSAREGSISFELSPSTLATPGLYCISGHTAPDSGCNTILRSASRGYDSPPLAKAGSNRSRMGFRRRAVSHAASCEPSQLQSNLVPSTKILTGNVIVCGGLVQARSRVYARCRWCLLGSQ